MKTMRIVQTFTPEQQDLDRRRESATFEVPDTNVNALSIAILGLRALKKKDPANYIEDLAIQVEENECDSDFVCFYGWPNDGELYFEITED